MIDCTLIHNTTKEQYTSLLPIKSQLQYNHSGWYLGSGDCLLVFVRIGSNELSVSNPNQNGGCSNS